MSAMEIVNEVNDLTTLDPEHHWFCPRQRADDTTTCFDEDCLDVIASETPKEKEERLAKITKCEERRDNVARACKIMAFDGSDAEALWNKLESALRVQLTRCDICVREFHRFRSHLKGLLEQEYDQTEVDIFLEKFDRWNVKRICHGLDAATASLHDLEPNKRNIGALDSVGMFALFEALNCIPFLLNEQVLSEHFDQPFRLVQTKKKIKLPSYAPGMAAFLLSTDPDRSAWAHRNFSGIKRDLTAREFEYGVRPFLERAMWRVTVVNMEKAFLPTFWKACKHILVKMNKQLIADQLSQLNGNLLTLSLEHFQVDETHFVDLIDSYTVLLERGPDTFWAQMGTISAQNVVDTILRSPTLIRLLKITAETEPLHLDKKLEWCVPFVRSIKPAVLVPPVGSLLHVLLGDFQREPYSRWARSVSREAGLACILQAMDKMSQLQGGLVVSNLLDVIAKNYIDDIVDGLEGIEKKDELQIDEIEQVELDIVEKSLALAVQSLTHDRSVIMRTATLDHEITDSHLGIWKSTCRAVRNGQPTLVTTVLTGISGLLPLEPFTKRQLENGSKHTKHWNQALAKVLDVIHDDLLGRLETFDTRHLDELYVQKRGAHGLVALLFNADDRIHQAGLNVVKALCDQDNRRDCLLHLTSTYLGTTLEASAKALDAVAQSKSYGPCPVLVKLCADVFNCLCDPTDGVLRSGKQMSASDLKTLDVFWAASWNAMRTIFNQTEPWSQLGYDKDLMAQFCRATMDLADFAFEQYTIIAHRLKETSSEEDGAKLQKRLLSYPREAFSSISKWLRLRDDYLIATAVNLTSKILIRLHEVQLKVSSTGASFIEEVVTSTDARPKVRTRLTMNQKAELCRALETHLGQSVGHEPGQAVSLPKKQGSLAGWAKSGSSTPTGDAKPRSGVIDVDAWSAANDSAKTKREAHPGNDRARPSVFGDSASRQPGLGSKPPMPGRAAAKKVEDPTSFLLKRKQEKEAADKKKAEYLAKQKLGAGTGVHGLGNMGKDHSLKGQNVMVSSDEESDEDDELDSDLFGSINRDKKKTSRAGRDEIGFIAPPPERRLGPTKIRRTVRSQQDMRARLAPDLAPLHKVILQWDFFHEGDYPPGAKEHIFRAVAGKYNDPTSYQDTFEPLLTLEAWQGIVRTREELERPKIFDVKVNTRTNVDWYLEIGSLVTNAENRELSMSEGDLVLLSAASRNIHQDSSAPHCLARVYRVKRSKLGVDIIYQVLSGTSLAPSLTPQSVVYGVKVSTLTPLEREYGALQALQYYDLCQQIIQARPSNRMKFNDKQIAAYQDVYNVNRAQSEAINAALDNEGFSLIQGPPGSGKTKTIVAIVGGMLSNTLGGSSTSNATKLATPAQAAPSSGPAKKLLVCAPSNAAVDELVMRLKQGVRSKSGRHFPLNLVRIGRSEAINSQVQDVTMEELVSKRMGSSSNDDKTREKNAALFKEHETVSAHLRDLYQQKDGGKMSGKELSELEQQISAVRKHKNDLGVKIDNVKDQERNAGREQDLNRKRMQQAVLDESHVICATLSGSGHDMFRTLNVEFETIIIDEAAQCVEMSSLIPLKYGCVKCIMVGDPKQLPPTVFSREAAKFQYEQSLFVRMQNNHPDEVYLLDTQYRMHPAISLFPSRTFYDGLLRDGEGMEALRKQPWHASSLLAPYRFFDVQGQHEKARIGGSLTNKAEVEVAMALYRRVTKDFGSYDFNGHIGIITPYKSQLGLLKRTFTSSFGPDIVDKIEFNTTDAFQGRESEIIIFSCVRASPAGGIGFLQDIRRMNVGLTRAKSSLWVLGHAESLTRGGKAQYWKKLIDDAEARDSFTSGNVLAMLQKPSSAFKVKDDLRTTSMHDVGNHVTQMERKEHQKPEPEPEPVRKASISSNRVEVKHEPQESAPVKAPTHPRSDRMEGITKNLAAYTSDKKKNSLKREEDVEMKDAEDSPEPSSESESENQAPHINGNAKPVGTGSKPAPRSAVPPAMVRKRPAASPFMPTKKKPAKR